MKPDLGPNWAKLSSGKATPRKKMKPGWRLALRSAVVSNQKLRRNVQVRMPTFNLPPIPKDEDGNGSE